MDNRPGMTGNRYPAALCIPKYFMTPALPDDTETILLQDPDHLSAV